MSGRDQVGISVLLWFEFLWFKSRIWHDSIPRQPSESTWTAASVAQIAEHCIRRLILHYKFNLDSLTSFSSCVTCIKSELAAVLLSLRQHLSVVVRLQNVTETEVKGTFLAQISSSSVACRGMLSMWISSVKLLAAAVFFMLLYCFLTHPVVY